MKNKTHIKSKTTIHHLENLQFHDILNMVSNLDLETFHFLNIGKNRNYHDTWELQKQLHQLKSDKKIPNILLLLQHQSVYTFGKNAKR